MQSSGAPGTGYSFGAKFHAVQYGHVLNPDVLHILVERRLVPCVEKLLLGTPSVQ
jgi:hypothetical protein